MIYIELLIAFLKVGLFSFGGAYGSIPLIRDVVLSHGWMTEEQIAYMIAVSESTPGPIMVNLATYIGNTQAGLLGSVVATLGVVLPSFCVILLITAILKSAMKNKYMQAILRGLKPCVIGIVLATGLYMILTNCMLQIEEMQIDVVSVVITVILGAVVFVYQRVTKKKLSPIMLISISAVVGVVVCSFVR